MSDIEQAVCDDCRRSTAGTCWKHQPGALMEAVMHRHVWVYDGQAPDARFIYHCDRHDPPVVRLVPDE